MQLTEYHLAELRFAYVYHCYLRWQTYRSRLVVPLKELDAATSGKSTSDQIDVYLAGQGAHHGYAQRVVPPLFVANYAPSTADDARLQPAHASAFLRFHVVLATWRRQGVFGRIQAEAVARCWRELESAQKFAILKVSFVPDHVHLAVRVHPSVAPATIVIELMNAAQALLWEDFAPTVIQARVERLWQPSAYVGSFGDRGQAPGLIARCR